MNNSESQLFAQIPLQFVGPIKMIGPVVDDLVSVPMATFETPLWPSTNRGARISQKCDGIKTVIVDERMARSIAVQASSAEELVAVVSKLKDEKQTLGKIAEGTSRFAKFLDAHFQFVGNILYIRIEMQTGDASGHNMVTKAAEAVLNYILTQFPNLSYVSLSGNYCTDKKVSAVNGILGRGKNVIAEMLIPEKLLNRFLKTSADKIVELNIKKNLIGSIAAGSLRAANAHFANMLLAFYLATGQDAANIVEGSQGFVHTEADGNDLYFSVTLPNLIVGTIGNGKGLDFVKENLDLLGCSIEREPGENARRLAAIAAATVLCGELSLMAALTNQGELMQAHERLERA